MLRTLYCITFAHLLHLFRLALPEFRGPSPWASLSSFLVSVEGRTLFKISVQNNLKQCRIEKYHLQFNTQHDITWLKETERYWRVWPLHCAAQLHKWPSLSNQQKRDKDVCDKCALAVEETPTKERRTILSEGHDIRYDDPSCGKVVANRCSCHVSVIYLSLCHCHLRGLLLMHLTCTARIYSVVCT